MYHQIPLASTLQKIPSPFCFDLSCNYSCLPIFHISPSYHLYHDFIDFPALMVHVPLFVCIVIQIMYLHLKLQLRITKERGHMTLRLCKLSLYNIFQFYPFICSFISYFFTTEEHFIVYLEHIFIIHSSGCLSCFHIVALVNLTALNMTEQVSVWQNFETYKHMGRYGMAGSYGKFIFN